MMGLDRGRGLDEDVWTTLPFCIVETVQSWEHEFDVRLCSEVNGEQDKDPWRRPEDGRWIRQRPVSAGHPDAR